MFKSKKCNKDCVEIRDIKRDLIEMFREEVLFRYENITKKGHLVVFLATQPREYCRQCWIQRNITKNFVVKFRDEEVGNL